MLVQAIWSLVLAAVTLGILWNTRNRSVYIWCAGGPLGSISFVMLWGPIAEATYDLVWAQYLLGSTLIGSAWLKAAAIRLLAGDRQISGLSKLGAAMLLALLIAPWLPLDRTWFSTLIVLSMASLMGLFAVDALRLGAKVFSSIIVLHLTLIVMLAISMLLTGQDPLAPITNHVPLGSPLFGMLMSLIINAAFISLILDLRINQLQETRKELIATQVEQSRLEEREQLLADMHDGLGSQLAGAKLRAERGQMTQEQMIELLRECMADLHLLVDSLSDHGQGLAAAIVDHRYRTERRLLGIDLQLEWRVALDHAPTLPPSKTIQVLRIIQEAINNTLKHAKAARLIIEVRFVAGSGFLIRIEDDGDGLPEQAASGQGLRNMQRRARDLGATLSLRGGPQGRGTIVEVSFPAATPEESR